MSDYADALKQLREILPPDQKKQLDDEIAELARKRWRHFMEMERMVQALAVLHRPGGGEKSGFCAECGNVVPCQTAKFIEPYLVVPK